MPLSPKPASRTYGWLALVLLAFAIYVSVIPLDLRAVPLNLAGPVFWESITSPNQQLSRTNFLANVLLFVPIGFSLMGMVLADRRRSAIGWVAAFTVSMVISISASAIAEFLQVFAPSRVPSGLDIAAQMIGALLGVVIWSIAGSRLTNWARAALAGREQDRLSRLLSLYVAAWIFVNLAPFDITVDLGLLAERFRSGDIVVVPFDTSQGVARRTWDVFAGVISAVPLGVFGLAVGALIVAAIEFAQIFIRSHAADVTDVISGSLGVLLGVVCAQRMVSITRRAPSKSSVLPWQVAPFLVWCLVLVAYHWQPYDFAIDIPAVRQKLSSISFVPFTGYVGSDLDAFNDVLVKIGLAMPLGIAAALIRGRTGTHSLAFTIGAVAATGLVFAIVELGQFFLPTRTPNPTDVILGVIGAFLGLKVGHWVDWTAWPSIDRTPTP